MEDATNQPETASESGKRKPGRKPGAGRVPGSGRRKGVPNRTHVETRDFIQKRADPVAFLCDVSLGLLIDAAPTPGSTERVRVRPTLEQRIAAATTLAKKVVPDVKAVEHSGKEGEPMSVRINLGSPA